MARHGAAGAPRCATLSNIGARRGRSTSHRPTLLNRRLCLYGPLCTANFTLMGMLHLIARRPHASRKYVKYAVTGCLLPLPIPIFHAFLCLSPILSYFSRFSLSLSLFNSRKRGGRTGFFFKSISCNVYTSPYRYTYAPSDTVFYFYFI